MSCTIGGMMRKDWARAGKRWTFGFVIARVVENRNVVVGKYRMSGTFRSSASSSDLVLLSLPEIVVGCPVISQHYPRNSEVEPIV